MNQDPSTETLSAEAIQKQMLDDYRLICLSREASLLGRKEVLTGKAKFGIFGDGKELAQIAMARQFKKGDFRSGYYRDQTFMMALGELTVQQYFAALYAHADVNEEPTSGGRQMGGHYATRSLNPDGSWKNLMEQNNSSADISPTAGQMPRLLGLAQASKVYRQNEALHSMTQFTDKGNEVAFGTIGDASTSEGLFWETMNAAAVLQVPMAMSIWDDGFGISVSRDFQTVKSNISEALSGFQKQEGTNGVEIYRVKGWNYPDLLVTYEKAVKKCRKKHLPVLIHVQEVTQPQGHSTSGSHERYKTKEQLEWTEEYDCLNQFKKFLILDGAASEDELDAIRTETKKQVRQEQKAAWISFRSGIDQDMDEAIAIMKAVAGNSANRSFVEPIIEGIRKTTEPIRKDILAAARKILRITRGEQSAQRQSLSIWVQNCIGENNKRYSGLLYSESSQAVGNIASVPAEYASEPEMIDGRLILRDNFDALFTKYPEILTFGEDTGKIGGVNQTMEGMQEKFGELRVSDTGIREATILGQGIGMALRGLRPIAEIQYLDYIYYALQIMRDDLATVQYRTYGGQKAPVIIRTRGHRLEGIWHSGSPMGAIISSIRGINVCVPRNMTQAAGMYNTLIESDEPALVVECLNGYRSKEPKPTNLGEFRVPLGVPEVIREGTDITVVSYGSTFNLCKEAAVQLTEIGIDVELVDVQTLLPFDIHGIVAKSVAKTNRVIFIDEDVPGGASAFMLDQVVNKQGAWSSLDSQPVTLTSKPHLPAYGTDGDYFSKPNIEDIIEAIYKLMHEADPQQYPSLF